MILQESRVRPGDRLVEIGCGIGALLAQAAAIIGSAGEAIGLEPQPALAAAARARVAAFPFAHVMELDVASAELEPGSVDACVAQTTLIHLPVPQLPEVLSQCARLMTPNGRFTSADQDGDTWVIDHPDRGLTRKIVEFNSDQRYGDGWTGRKLPRLLAESGFEDVRARPHVHVDREPYSYLLGMAERMADAASAAGVIDSGEAIRWKSVLADGAVKGCFFSSITYFVTSGRRGAPVRKGALWR